MSSRKVMARLRTLYTSNTGSSLTDQAAADALQEEGIQVSRRTVAKYRQEMGIPPFRERMRWR